MAGSHERRPTGRAKAEVYGSPGDSETTQTAIRARIARTLIEKAVDDFVDKYQRFPNWDIVDITITNTTVQVIARLEEVES